MIDVSASACLLTAAIAHFSGDMPTVKGFGAIGVALKWTGLLDFMRAFSATGPFVRMISVIARDLRWFMAIAFVFLFASASFFLIHDGDRVPFDFSSATLGPLWPLFTMWRGMLGDFDVMYLQSQTSIIVYIVFQIVVFLLMMNLVIAIMGDSYEMVKENEIVEALHERAKIIVDFELLYPRGFPLLGAHLRAFLT